MLPLDETIPEDSDFGTRWPALLREMRVAINFFLSGKFAILDENGSGKSAQVSAAYAGKDDNGEDIWILKLKTIEQ